MHFANSRLQLSDFPHHSINSSIHQFIISSFIKSLLPFVQFKRGFAAYTCRRHIARRQPLHAALPHLSCFQTRTIHERYTNDTRMIHELYTNYYDSLSGVT